MKKILSVLLALSMMLSCMPMAVLADETQPEIVETEPTVSETTAAAEPAAVCTCESDDPAYHAPFCALFAMPENPVCCCAVKCTADAVNEWCDVCYFDLAACGGEEDMAAPFDVETSAPVIHSVTVDKAQVSPGESVTVTMRVTDESELDLVYVSFDTPHAGVTNAVNVHLSKASDDTYTGTLTVDSSFVSGVYNAYVIVAQDIHGNREQISYTNTVYFEVIDNAADTEAPVIEEISLDKTTVIAGESVTVTMKITDESELDDVYIQFDTPFAGVVKTLNVNLTKDSDGLYHGTLATDDGLPSGIYYSYVIVVTDVHGNRNQISYDKSIYFELVNGGVETNAPVINNVTVDKTQVQSGETVTITADVTDESELENVHVFIETPLAGVGNEILVYLSPDGNGSYSGTLTTDSTFSNGTYYIQSCVAKDVYGNREQISARSVSFQLTGGYEDTKVPVIDSVSFDRTAVTAGETVVVTVNVTDESEVENVHVFIETPLAGVGNEILVYLSPNGDGSYSGTLTTDSTFSNGTYYIQSCVAKDVHGNREQISARSVSFQLTGGHSEVGAPVINSVTFDRTKIGFNETVTVTADITDESKMSNVHIFLKTPLSGVGNDILVYLSLAEDGLYKGTFSLSEQYPYGTYSVSACVAKDVHGNRAQISAPSTYVELGGNKIETNAPVIHSVSVDKTQVRVGDTVTVIMDVTDESELETVYVVFDTPHAGVVKTLSVKLTKCDDGLYRGTLTTDDSLPYGFYYTYVIVAQDVLTNRNQISYDKSLYFELVSDKALAYTVTWNIDGEFYAETEVKSGETITAPAYTVPEGYTFSGWDIPETMPAEDIELDATLTINTYKVTWNVDGAETEEEYTYGDPIVAPEDPSKAGNRCVSYSFKMWDGFAEGMTMPAEDLTFTAVFDVTENHRDRNKDHICDRKCGKTDIGEHADSATDRDHRCDYGCKATLEACFDKDGDRNHNCDICRKKNVTAHTYAEATCTKPATCTECGAKRGKLKTHTWDDGKVLKEPTCTRPGVMGFKCKDCNKFHIEMIKPEGHEYIRNVCRNCGDKKHGKPIFHNWWH